MESFGNGTYKVEYLQDIGDSSFILPEKAIRKRTFFLVGEEVEANLEGMSRRQLILTWITLGRRSTDCTFLAPGKWYDAKIVLSFSNRTYKIKYLKPFTSSTLPGDGIRKKNWFNIHEEVEAKYKGAC